MRQEERVRLRLGEERDEGIVGQDAEGRDPDPLAPPDRGHRLRAVEVGGDHGVVSLPHDLAGKAFGVKRVREIHGRGQARAVIEIADAVDRPEQHGRTPDHAVVCAGYGPSRAFAAEGDRIAQIGTVAAQLCSLEKRVGRGVVSLSGGAGQDENLHKSEPPVSVIRRSEDQSVAR